MVEDSSAINVTFQFVYLNNFTMSLGYSNFSMAGNTAISMIVTMRR